MSMDDLRTLLLVVLALPAVAAVAIACLGPRNGPAVRWTALGATVLNLLLTVVLVGEAVPRLKQPLPENGPATFRPTIVPGDPGRDAETHDTGWVLMPLGDAKPGQPVPAVRLYLGLDGLNIWLVALTSFLMVPSVLVSWTSVTERDNEFFAWLLALQTGLTGVFLAFDIILFYVFFELTLVPLFFVIGIWGGPARREAARKFFLYTLTGSLITLLGLIGLVLAVNAQTGELTFSIPELVKQVQQQLATENVATRAYWRQVQVYVFFAMALGFAIKVPLFPLHTWLPLAHVEAPTAGSVLLAGVLLKLGTYGFLRLCLPLVPDACLSVGVPLIGTLAVIGIIYGALCAYAQTDIKKLVAYSSVSHLGFCVLGLFALNAAGIAGSLVQMVNHGLSTGGLFLLVGMLYERYHTRSMGDYGGMAARLKVLSLFMVFVCLTSVGMPFLNGFVGEMLVMAGIFDLQGASVSGPLLGVAGAVGIVLGALYLITLLAKVFFGPLKEPHHDGPAVGDLNVRELAALVPLGALCLLIGLYPQPMLDATARDVGVVAKISQAARDRAAPRSAAVAGAPAPMPETR